MAKVSVYGSWSQRGRPERLTPGTLEALLQGVNNAILESDHKLEQLHRMTGVGHMDATYKVSELLQGWIVLNSYVTDLPGDLEHHLDFPLFEQIKNGPVEALSQIRADEITTDNLTSLTGMTQESQRGNIAGFPHHLPQVSFDDLAGSGDSETGYDLFAQVFSGFHEDWQSSKGEGDPDLDIHAYINALLASGEFDHEAYHPIRSFASDVLAASGLWGILTGTAGYDPLTGEHLSGPQQVLTVFMGAVDLMGLIFAGATGGQSVAGAGAAGAAIRAMLMELAVNLVANGVAAVSYDVAIALGLDPGVAALIAMGMGLFASVAGTTLVIFRIGPDGQRVVVATRELGTLVGRDPSIPPVIGDRDGGAGAWALTTRNEKGADYQAQISGVPITVHGTVEYRVHYTPSNPNGQQWVDFDGHVWRGQPPQEYFLDAKDDYSHFLANPQWEGARQEQLIALEAQALRQIAARNQTSPDAKIEWHFSGEGDAMLVREYFADRGIGIDVIHT